MSILSRSGLAATLSGILLVSAAVGILAAQSERRQPSVDDSQSAYRRTARDQVDAAGPYDEPSVRRLQQVEDYLNTGRPNRALETLAYTLDQADGGLVRLKDGRLVPISTEVYRLLGELPSRTLDNWRRRYAEVAKELLHEGIAKGRLDLIEQVAREFRLTKAGGDALWRLARAHADRGQFALAARILRNFKPRDLPVTARIRAARILVAVDHRDEARRWMESISHDDWKALRRAAAEFDVVTLARSLPGGESRTTANDGWRLPFGGSAGFALTPPGSPLMLSRWSRPLTPDIKLQEAISRYNEDVQQRMHAVIPAAIPLVCEKRVFARMGDRVCAFDLATGRLLWESARHTALLSPRAREAAIELPGMAPGQVVLGNPFLGRGRGNNRNPIAEFLYRDGVAGLISADSERVYLVRSLAEPGGRERAPHMFGLNRFRTRSPGPGANELHAFDIETGRPAWRNFGGIGGSLDLGAFARPLTGYFFFGPPVPIDGDLYVIGEKDSRIELIALDPHTGMKRWSRKIATAPLPISQEPIRQNWNAQVAASGGILVCPTTVGWLVAVDRTNHSLLWAYRYAPVEPAATNTPTGNRLMPVALGRRWAPAAPIIADGRVFFTPPEDQHLVCLDLVTGRRIWQHGKARYRYVAGVAGDCLVVVGSFRIAGFDAATRKELWSLRIPQELGSPTGRGVLSEGQFILPTGRAILTIDTNRGKLIDTLLLAEGQRPLGNLVMRAGVLVSLGAGGLSVYEECGDYLERIASAQAESPNTDLAQFMRARLQFAEGELEAAAEMLAEIDFSHDHAPDGISAQRVRRLRWKVLTRLVQSDPAAGAGHLEVLDKLSRTAAQNRVVQRLRAASLAAAGKLAEAAKLQLQLLSPHNGTVIEARGPGHRRVCENDSIAGNLLDLWQSASEAEQAEIQSVVNQILAACDDPARRETMIRAVSRLPFAREHILDLVRQESEHGLAAEEEIALLRLLESSEPASRGPIYGKLAELARRHHFPTDAQYWREKQAALDTTNHPAAEATVAPLPHRDETPGRYVWSDLQVTTLGGVNRSFSHSVDERELAPHGCELPSYQRVRLWLNAQSERLFRHDGRHAESRKHAELMSIPLRGREDGTGFSPAFAVGHVLVLVFDGVVQAVSLLDRRVIWSWDIEASRPFHPNRGNRRPMRTSPGFRVSQSLARHSKRAGSIIAANANYVLVRHDGRIMMLDILTGRRRWSRDQFEERSLVFGTANFLFISRPSGNPRDVRLVRAIDGDPVERHSAGHVQRTIGVVGNALLTLGRGGGGTLLGQEYPSQPTFSLYDPLANQRLWSRRFPVNALFERAPEGTIYVLAPDEGTLTSLDPETGRLREIGTIPTDVLNHRNEVYLLTDPHSVYVIVNQGHTGLRFLGSELPTIAVNGDMYVFDRHSSGLRWHREIDSQRLLLRSLPHMPLLLFMSGRQRRVNNQTAWQTRLHAIDKASGTTVLDRGVYTRNNSRFRRMEFRPQRGLIELVTFSGRIRISAARRVVPVVAPRADAP